MPKKVIVQNVSGRDGTVLGGGPVVAAKPGTKKKPGRIKFGDYPDRHGDLMAKAIAYRKVDRQTGDED